jgi:excisionase family DNA binding protein
MSTGERLLKMNEVVHRVGLCKGYVYKKIRANRFPACRKVGRSSRWLESEVDAFIAACAAGIEWRAAE